MEGASKSPIVRVLLRDGGEAVMRVTRDRQPATLADVEFIAASRQDVVRLGEAIRGRRPIATDELDEIEQRVESTTPGPWRAFLESDGGSGGSNVIRVSDGDAEPDMYLWIGTRLAIGGDFEFVAKAHELIPQMIDFLRRQAT
jgi:hypothetical protein